MTSIAELLCVRSDGKERFDGELAEHLVALRISTAHKNDHLVVELERVWFEFDTLKCDRQLRKFAQIHPADSPRDVSSSTVAMSAWQQIACPEILIYVKEETKI